MPMDTNSELSMELITRQNSMLHVYSVVTMLHVYSVVTMLHIYSVNKMTHYLRGH